jgi:hypothetical protein
MTASAFDAPIALRAGLGIGMSSMRARMERMGGALHVRSRPGHTVIEACLPLADLGAAAPLPAPAPAHAAHAHAVSGLAAAAGMPRG